MISAFTVLLGLFSYISATKRRTQKQPTSRVISTVSKIPIKPPKRFKNNHINDTPGDALFYVPNYTQNNISPVFPDRLKNGKVDRFCRDDNQNGYDIMKELRQFEASANKNKIINQSITDFSTLSRRINNTPNSLLLPFESPLVTPFNPVQSNVTPPVSEPVKVQNSRSIYGPLIEKASEIFSTQNIRAYGVPLAMKAFEIYQQQKLNSLFQEDSVPQTKQNIAPTRQTGPPEINFCIDGRNNMMSTLSERFRNIRVPSEPEQIISTRNVTKPEISIEPVIKIKNLESQIKNSVSHAIGNKIQDIDTDSDDEDNEPLIKVQNNNQDHNQASMQYQVNDIVRSFTDILSHASNQQIVRDLEGNEGLSRPVGQNGVAFPENMLEADN